MPYYYNKDLKTVKEFSESLYLSWLESENPKANSYVLINDPPSTYSTYDGSSWITYEQTIEQWRETVICSKRQGMRALVNSGLLSIVKDWILIQNEEDQIDWDCAIEWHRNWPLIEKARIKFEWTQEQVDELFRLAVSL